VVDHNCDGVVSVSDTQLATQFALGVPLNPIIDNNNNQCVDACETDLDSDGQFDALDCAPHDDAIVVGAPELCNGYDDNCDGVVDGAGVGTLVSCSNGDVCDGVETCGAFPDNLGVVINEIMAQPASVSDAAGEWLELFNGGSAPVNIQGWRLSDEAGQVHTINAGGALFVPARGYLVLARNTNSTANGGVRAAYQYSGFDLNATADVVALLDNSQTLQDRVQWGPGLGFPVAVGKSMALRGVALDNAVGSNWALSTASLVADPSTPVGPNRDVMTTACNAGAPLFCADGNPCTSDSCNPVTGCQFAPNTTPCTDGNPCTSGDVCAGGVCSPGAPLLCNDGTACTQDSCSQVAGCVNGPISCDDGIPCTVDSCSPTLGCVHNASACPALVCGTVTATTGGPIVGASVSLACNALTNVLKSATTDEMGKYCLSLQGTELNCTPHLLSARSVGFAASTKVTPTNFTLAVQTTTTVNFALAEFEVPTCFSDGFESALTWTATAPANGASWQVKSNSQIVVNPTIGLCVALPPNEVVGSPALCEVPNQSACIPVPGALANAYSGTKAVWYGGSSNGIPIGNFLGAGTCLTASGGNSATPHSGSLTSQPFTLGSGKAKLSFQAWWEIEGVDPQQFAFDRMLVEVLPSGGSLATLGTLNPILDTNSADNVGYSSGGLNSAPVWSLYEFDLSAYANSQIQLRFRFSTEDESFNGFRGWMIDNVIVSGSACCVGKSNGTPCDDGSVCTIDETCNAGACVAAATVSCVDGVPCTDDACDPATGLCQFTPKTCNDGTACTADACNPTTGACSNTPLVVCDDGSLCTADSCDPISGQCVFTPKNCNDNSACTADSCDPATGVCSNTVTVTCDDGSACTTDVCVPATGTCHFAAKDCDDGNPCTTHACDPLTGVCSTGAVDCSDGNACTTDVCDAAEACHRGVILGGTCYRAEHRVNTTYAVAKSRCAALGGALVSITSAQRQTAAVSARDLACGASAAAWIGLSDAATEGVFVWESGAPLQYTQWGAGQPNSGASFDFVALSGASGLWDDLGTIFANCYVCERLLAGTPGICRSTAKCTDDDLCTTNTCDAQSGVCSVAPATCSDGNACTNDTCTPTSPCPGGVTAGGKCFRAVSSQVTASQAATLCTGQGGALATINSVFEQTAAKQARDQVCGSVNAYIGLSDANTEGTYLWPGNVPLTFSNWSVSEPNNQGNEDAVEMYDTGAWNDTVATTGKPCAICQVPFANSPSCSSAPKSCDDGNACTVDACNTATGACTNTAGACNDNSVCTADSCDPLTGNCTYTPTVVCNDGVPCTDDFCHPTLGTCYTAPKLCTDGDNCTTETCTTSTGQCVSTPIVCNDNDACTTDTCDPLQVCHGGVVFGDLCIRAHREPVGQAQAKSACIARGGQLVSITSGAKQTAAVQAQAKACGAVDAWIGLTDETTEGTFKWLNGASLGYTNWAANEPNEGGPADGVEMFGATGAWGDSVFTASNQCYICESPLYNTGQVCQVDPNCHDGNLCTDDLCSAQSGACSFDNSPCDDGDPCTTDSCTFTEPCPGGVEFDGKCFKAFVPTTTANRAASQTLCAGQGGALPTLRSLNESNAMLEAKSLVCPASTQAYLALTDSVTEGVYLWPGNVPLTFANWGTGEPNNTNNEDFVHILSSGLWNDNNGLTGFSCVVCEVPPVQAPACVHTPTNCP
jgi:hypothetical protein